MNSYKIQLKLFKYYYILSHLLLFTSISFLFYQNKGLSIQQITFLKSITFITVLILEIPSGVLADIFPKKKLLLFSMLCFASSCLLNAISSIYILFILSVILYGSGMAFLSGCDNAWLYEFLDDNHKADNYSEIMGDLSFQSQIISGIGLLISSYLFTINLNLPYILNTIIFFIAGILVVFLKNTNKEFSSNFKNKTMFTTFKNGLNEIYDNKKLLSTISLTIIFSSFTILMFEYYQIYLTKIGFPIKFIGALYLIFTFTTGFGCKIAHKLENNFENEYTLLSIIVIIQSLLGISLSIVHNYFGLIILIAQEFLFGLMLVLTNSTINSCIRTDERATVLSTSSLLTSCIKIFIFPFSGGLISKTSVSTGYLIIGLLMLGFGLLFICLAKNKFLIRETLKNEDFRS